MTSEGEAPSAKPDPQAAREPLAHKSAEPGTDQEKLLDRKVKHLEMIQSIITRTAQNSFLVKGWAITLVVALFTFSVKDGPRILVLVGFVPAIFLWWMDGFFLREEKMFRKLYDGVAADIKNGTAMVGLFNMNRSRFNEEADVKTVWTVMTSKTLRAFYGLILVCLILGAVILNWAQLSRLVHHLARCMGR